MYVKFKKFVIIGAILLLVISIFLYAKVTKSNKDLSLDKISPTIQEEKSPSNVNIPNQDNKDYKSQTFSAGDYGITIIKPSCPYGDSPPYTCSKVDETIIPLIVIRDAKTNKVLSVYEVGFKTNRDYSGQIESGNNVYLSSSNYKEETIEDFPFVTEWIMAWGGSSGIKGLVLFDLVNNQLLPVTGYDEAMDEDAIVLKDKVTSKTYEFPVISDMTFTNIQDLNNDGHTDLLYGYGKWERGESHRQARPWHLKVYEYKDNKFEIAKWWNSGEEYTTKENIGYEKKDEWKLIETFNLIRDE